MAVSGKTAAPHEIPYFLDSDKPPNMATVTKAMADRLQARLDLLGIAAVKNIPAEQSTTSGEFVYLGTEDKVSVTLPTDGLIFLLYSAIWASPEVAGAGEAAIYIGANRLKRVSSGVPVEQGAGTVGKAFQTLATSSAGLVSTGEGTSFVATGMLLGSNAVPASPATIAGPAGTYDVGVKFRGGVGNKVTAKQRRLWVWTKAFE